MQTGRITLPSYQSFSDSWGSFMKELSLNILDIAENSVKAGATLTEILITETKLKKERVIVMHDDMNRLMRKYSIQVILAGREQSSYFFPDPDLEAYTTAWLENILKICYRNANPEISAERLSRIRVYDLRHRFASATLCRWLDEGKNLYNMLPYLRTYMGHSSLSQTAYYIHILPENLLKSCSIDWSKLDNIIPEDDIWDE